MPKCYSCNKVFKSWQDLGNHIKKYLENNEDELSLPNQQICKNSPKLVEIISGILNNQNILKKQNMPKKTEINNKRINLEQNLNNSQEDIDESIKEQIYSIPFFSCTRDIQNCDEFIEKQDIEFFDYASDSQSSNSSVGDNAVSDLSDITDVDTNKYAKDNDLFARKPKDLKDVYKEFLSKKYAEFMHIVIQFHIQNSLANVFIRFFNKYSSCNDQLLPSIS
ncbi:6018_t:CDS:1 [Racocetra persica]|uniref:6018_t:CDS:1 n=1 Tax=Racocetra persica TaxID=160502 RepID=A0ACA9N068_9GLOM|nr:6018_t:CDS:1 [Racocetra persica]